MNSLTALKYLGSARVELRTGNRGSRRYAVSVIDRTVREHRRFSKWMSALRFALMGAGVHNPLKRISVRPGNYIYLINSTGTNIPSKR